MSRMIWGRRKLLFSDKKKNVGMKTTDERDVRTIKETEDGDRGGRKGAKAVAVRSHPSIIDYDPGPPEAPTRCQPGSLSFLWLG